MASIGGHRQVPCLGDARPLGSPCEFLCAIRERNAGRDHREVANVCEGAGRI